MEATRAMAEVHVFAVKAKPALINCFATQGLKLSLFPKSFLADCQMSLLTGDNWFSGVKGDIGALEKIFSSVIYNFYSDV